MTDEEAPGELPDVPQTTDGEIDFLLDTVNTALATPLTRDDVLGSFAGLRPLLDTTASDAEGSTADLSRKHAVIRTEGGPIGIVGGKLTTYRKMAEDAVDAAIEVAGLSARPCRTRHLPVVGAANSAVLGMLTAPQALVQRYGAEASLLAADPSRLERVAPGIDITRAEVEFAVSHEGALDVDDVLDRRTRIGLVPRERARAEEAVAAAFG